MPDWVGLELLITCVSRLNVQLSGVRLISLCSIRKNLSKREDAQYILARAAENFLESQMDSYGDNGNSHICEQLKPSHIHISA